MRPAAPLLLAAIVAAGAGLGAEPSAAQAPARASASAALVDGTSGRRGTLRSRGDGRRVRVRPAGASAPSVRVRRGELRVLTSRAGGDAIAEATAVAQAVTLLDGAVTATGVRRRLVVRAGRRSYTGRVTGLEVDGRKVGTVTDRRRFELDGGGTVRVNTGASALTVQIAARRISVATVSASARDGADPAATPTPTPAPRATRTPTPTPTPTARPTATPKPKAARRRAPKVGRRLTVRGFTFPVFGRKATIGGPFGAPRQIGAHQGNDIFAPFGAPVLAVTDGELFKVGTLPISGNRLWLRSKAGDEFFYAHLSAFSPAAVNGRRVRAGEVLGFTGNTGDAEPTPPHVHFEIHPGGGDAVDPRAILVAWRGKRDVPPGAWLTRYGADTAPRPGALVEVRDLIAAE